MDNKPIRNHNNWLLIAAGLLVGLGIGLIILAAIGASGPLFASMRAMQGNRSPVVEVNAPAPDFSLQNLDGDTVSLESMRGKVVLLNFWATWCGPCRVEMPTFEEVAQSNPEDLVILGVNVDESPAVVAAYRDELGLTFPLLLDPGAQVSNTYRARGLPTSYIIDRDGVIRYQHIGSMDAGQLARYLESVGLE